MRINEEKSVQVALGFLSIISVVCILGYVLAISVAAKSHRLDLNPAPLQSASQVVLYRGDAHRTGAYEGPGLRTMSRVRWQTAVGEITHGPAVFADGLVYLMGSNGRLQAIDSATGNRVWAFKPKPATPLFSAVAVADGVVYVGQNLRLYALNARTGKKVWKIKTKGLALTAPLVVGPTVYFSCFDNKLYAVNATTGEKRWTITIGDSDTPPVYDNGTIYLSAADSTTSVYSVYAIDSETGQQKWKIDRPASSAWTTGIAFADELLYIGSVDGMFQALDSQTGEVIWSYSGGGGDFAWSRPAVADDLVYIGNKDQYVTALNKQTGEMVWRFKAEASATADPIVAGGVVYFGEANFDDTIEQRYFYGVDAQTGEQLWRFQADGRIIAGAAIGDGAIYFATNVGATGTLYAIE